MDEQSAVDRMLETENLTDELDDEDAEWLLNWGTEHIKPLIADIADADAGGKKVNELMAAMRQLNKLAPKRADLSPEVLSVEVQKFTALYNTAFGHLEVKTARAASIVTPGVAAELMQKSTQGFMEGVIHIAEESTVDAPAPGISEDDEPNDAVEM